jgi:membrane fusion protein, heavy metal efflux system
MSQFVKYFFIAWLSSQVALGWCQTNASTPSLHPFVLTMNEAQQAAVGIRTGKILSATQTSILATAQVAPIPGQEIVVSAPYAGQISKLLVGVGDRVKAGQVLAEFTSPQLADIRRQWLQAKLELQNAQSALQRDEAMFSEGIIPAIRVQLTRNKAEIAKATWAALESELQSAGLDIETSNSYASAPLRTKISGTVSEAFASIGQRIDAGNTLFKISNDDKLQLNILLSNDKALSVHQGDVVDIPARQARAKVIGISRSADASQSAKARAIIELRGQLTPGEWVNISIASSAKETSAARWLIPSRSMTYFENQPLIFIKQDKGFVTQNIKIISNNDESALVEALPNASSLNSNTRIAIQGIASLRAMLQKDE